MQVKLFSDLHLEFAEKGEPFHPGEGDILILAGDILTARNLNCDSCSPKRQKYVAFLEECSKNYNHVLYIAGNHEHYGYDISRSNDAIRSILPSNVTFLDNDEFVLGNWIFLGSTLWTNLKNNDPIVSWDISRSMNDCNVIRINDFKFSPVRWYAEHYRSFKWLENKLEEHKNKNVFVITHHAPSEQSIHESYRNAANQSLNYGFFTDLDEWIMCRPAIKYWVHGHIHNSKNYMIGSTQVIANPRGYPGIPAENPDFDPELTINI